MTRRFIALPLAVAFLVLTTGCSKESEGRPAPVVLTAPSDPLLPDLVVVPMDELYVGNGSNGGTVLRFTTAIANVGAGPLVVTAQRPGRSSSDWSVVQWFDERDGTRSGTTVDGTMILGGHGHDHWHLRFGATYWLYDDAGTQLQAITKAGFCFFDQIHIQAGRSETPTEAVYPPDGCGNDRAVEVSMGLSAGWSDPYSWRLSDQSVDITDLPDGIYRLVARADPDGLLREADPQNNESWTRIRVFHDAEGLRAVDVVEAAPAAFDAS